MFVTAVNMASRAIFPSSASMSGNYRGQKVRSARKAPGRQYNKVTSCKVANMLDENSCSELLDWVTIQCKATPFHLKLRVGDTGTPAGRGLIATDVIMPDETIISVPEKGFLRELAKDPSASEGSEGSEGGLPWSTRMAVRILEGIHTSDKSGASNDDSWRLPWLNELPQVVTVPFQFSEEEILEVQDPQTIREARIMREIGEAGFQAVEERLKEINCTKEAFFGVLSVCHSRCFRFGKEVEHFTVPVIDMANHTLDPNSFVKYTVEPSQGLQAASEVGDFAKTTICFELKAGEDGIEPGEEITISYGDWPNDLFLLFFGFCAEDNPNDSVVIFKDYAELVNEVLFVATKDEDTVYEGVEWFEDLKEDLVNLLYELLGGGSVRLAVLNDGIDSALSNALGVLFSEEANLQALGSFASLQPTDVLKARCDSLLASLPTTLEEDAALLQSSNSQDLSDNMMMAINYRMKKKQILVNAIQCM